MKPEHPLTSSGVLWNDSSAGSNVLFAKGAPEMLVKPSGHNKLGLPGWEGLGFGV